jgi:hypothetical protein
MDRFFNVRNPVGLAKQYDCSFPLANGMHFNEHVRIWKYKQRKHNKQYNELPDVWYFRLKIIFQDLNKYRYTNNPTSSKIIDPFTKAIVD